MTDFNEWWQAEEEKMRKQGADDEIVLGAMRNIAEMAWDAAQSKWQPIETAPKGTYSEHKDDPEWVDPPRILLSTPEGVVIAYWDYYFDGNVGGHGYQGNETAWVGDDGELVEVACDTPMYWMPLPAAPQGEDK